MKSPEAALDDKLATTRTLPITAPEAIPKPPAGYQATEPEERSVRLKKVAKSLEAELLDALQECARLGADVTVLLGEYAPSGERAAPIAADLEEVMTTLSRVYALAQYLEERKALLLSDGRGYIDLVTREYEHHVDRKPALGSTFRDLVRFNESVSEAIREGIAEAKRQRAAESARAGGE
jgi:hypothetical protein